MMLQNTAPTPKPMQGWCKDAALTMPGLASAAGPHSRRDRILQAATFQSIVPCKGAALTVPGCCRSSKQMGQDAAGYRRCWRAVVCSAWSLCSKLRTRVSSERFFQFFLPCSPQARHTGTKLVGLLALHGIVHISALHGTFRPCFVTLPE